MPCLSSVLRANSNQNNYTMAKYFGLRGRRLEQAIIWTVILPTYILFGYNNAVAGGLLSLPSFVETFPRIDTLNTTGATKANNSRVQVKHLDRGSLSILHMRN